MKHYTAKEYGEILIGFGNKLLYLSSDEEGNSYSRVVDPKLSLFADEEKVIIYPIECKEEINNE